MRKRKLFAILMAWMLCGSVFCFPAAAETENQSYTFTLEADTDSVAVGDTVTLKVCLEEAGGAAFQMYAVSAGVRFNAALFELDSYDAGNGVNVSVNELSGGWDGWKDVSLGALCGNYNNGDTWYNPTLLVTMQLKAKAVGGSAVTVHDTEVSKYYGDEFYTSQGERVWLKVVREDDGSVDVGSGSSSGNSSSSSGSSSSGSSGSSGSSSSASGGSGGGGGGGSSDSSGAGSVEATTPSVTPAADTYQNVFTDVTDKDWYADAVKYVVQNDLFKGTGSTTFTPEGTMTRGMFVTVLHRYAGLPAAAKAAEFTDTEAGSWYADAVAWAAANHIVSGYGDGKFGPEDSITLEQMITVLSRYQNGTGTGTAPVKYGAVSSWAANAMSWADAQKLFNGVGGTLTAGRPATRAQVAAFIANFNELGKQDSDMRRNS